PESDRPAPDRQPAIHRLFQRQPAPAREARVLSRTIDPPVAHSDGRREKARALRPRLSGVDVLPPPLQGPKIPDRSPAQPPRRRSFLASAAAPIAAFARTLHC